MSSLNKDKRKYYYTSRLFPKNSFFIGVGSVLNLFGNYFTYNYSKTEEEADTKAIESDWGVIGCDLQDSISQYRKAKVHGRKVGSSIPKKRREPTY
jgi:hypothetical protein